MKKENKRQKIRNYINTVMEIGDTTWSSLLSTETKVPDKDAASALFDAYLKGIMTRRQDNNGYYKPYIYTKIKNWELLKCGRKPLAAKAKRAEKKKMNTDVVVKLYS